MNRTELDRAAKIIDRLLILLPSRDYNAVDLALLWLREHDHPGLCLSVATRDLMTAGSESLR
jgi:hypothetical protein